MAHGVAQAIIALGVGYKVADLTASDADVAAVQSAVDAIEADYITAADVTFEALNGNSDVGTGAAQVAQGNHTHA